MEVKHQQVKHLKIDSTLLSLLNSCYELEYADVASHFYQLATQTFQSEANIIGPHMVSVGKRRPRSVYDIRKRVEEPVEAKLSIWVVRGFFPNTGIPFKMTVYHNKGDTWGEHSGAKVELGRVKSYKDHTVNCYEMKEYVEQVAEAELLDRPKDEIKKPQGYIHKYKCMSPRGLALQKKAKKK